jgi:hypothetical protein
MFYAQMYIVYRRLLLLLLLTDSCKIERAQKTFARLCYNIFLFNLDSKKYEEILARLHLYLLFTSDAGTSVLCSLLMFSLTKSLAPPSLTPSVDGTLYNNQTPLYTLLLLTVLRLASLPHSLLLLAAGSKIGVFHHHDISLKYPILSNFTGFTNYWLLGVSFPLNS